MAASGVRNQDQPSVTNKPGLSAPQEEKAFSYRGDQVTLHSEQGKKGHGSRQSISSVVRTKIRKAAEVGGSEEFFGRDLPRQEKPWVGGG